MKPWSYPQKAVLRARYARGDDVANIAVDLGRTTDAVLRQVSRLGLKRAAVATGQAEVPLSASEVSLWNRQLREERAKARYGLSVDERAIWRAQEASDARQS